MTVNVQDVASLKWLIEAGADEAVGDSPRNAFTESAAKKKVGSGEPTEVIAASLHPVASSTLNRSSGKSVPLDLEAPTAAKANAQELSKTAGTLGELAAALATFEGCALKYTASNLVFGDGNPQADIMFIGEAPGADEDREGKPFVGVSGKLLDRMIAAIQLDRTTSYITNILPWRPPGNRKPSATEVAICLPFICRHIDLVDPKVLVFVGGTSASALLNSNQGITRLRGRWTNYCADKGDIPAIPIFHPAYLLRQPSLKRDAWKDLRAIRRKLDETADTGT